MHTAPCKKKAAVSRSTLRHCFEKEARHGRLKTKQWTSAYFLGHWICRPIFYSISIKELENILFCFHTKNEDKFLRAVQSFLPTFNWPKYLTSTKPVGRSAMLSIFLFAPQDKGQALHFWKANERNGNTFPFQRSAGFKGYWDKKKKKSSKLSAWWLNKIR